MLIAEGSSDDEQACHFKCEGLLSLAGVTWPVLALPVVVLRKGSVALELEKEGQDSEIGPLHTLTRAGVEHILCRLAV